MKLIEKHWAKIAMGVVALVGLILTTILLSNGIVKDVTLGEYTDKVANSKFFMLIAQELFFVGLLSFCTLGTIEKCKKINNYVLMTIAVIALVFAILSFTNGSAYTNYAQDQITTGYKTAEALPSGVAIPAIGNITKEQFISMLDANQFTLTANIYGSIVNMLIFAVIPMVYAAKGIFTKDK